MSVFETPPWYHDSLILPPLWGDHASCQWTHIIMTWVWLRCSYQYPVLWSNLWFEGLNIWAMSQFDACLSEQCQSPWPHSSTGTTYWAMPTHRGRGKWNSGASRDQDDQDTQFKLAFYKALDDPEVASKLARIISKAKKDLVKHISTLRQEVRSLRSSLQERDTTIAELRSEVQLLHDDLDALEQHGRRHSLCISGIRMREEGTTAAVVKLANEVLEIAPPLSTKDISVSHWLRKPGKPEQMSRPPLSCALSVGLIEIGWSGNART